MDEATTRLRIAYDGDAVRRGAVEPEPWRCGIVDGFAAAVAAAGGQRVLDLGCGAGQMSARLADAGFEVTAVDLSPVMVTHTTARGIRAVVADFNELPFDDASFDGALAFNSFVHTPPDRFGPLLTEARRVLVPGATLTVVLWGGTRRQGPLDDDWLDPPRFFSMLPDDELLTLPTPGFTRVDARFLHEEERHGTHPQVLTLTATP